MQCVIVHLAEWCRLDKISSKILISVMVATVPSFSEFTVIQRINSYARIFKRVDKNLQFVKNILISNFLINYLLRETNP